MAQARDGQGNDGAVAISDSEMGLFGAPAQYLRDAPNGSVATRRRHAGGTGCHRGGARIPMAPRPYDRAAEGAVNRHPKLPTNDISNSPLRVITPPMLASRRGGVTRRGVSLSSDRNRP